MTDGISTPRDEAMGANSDVPEFPHLNLCRWPFDVVPSSEGVEHWVGRPEVGKRLRRLVDGAVRVPTSRIVLLWATFGSGKTHALRYVEYLSLSRERPIAVYVVVPRGIRSFLDIFRAIVDAMLERRVLDGVGRELLRTHGLHVKTDSERALVRLAVGSEEEQRLAAAWLRGDRLPARDLRAIGLTRRIETVTDAVQALHDIVDSIHLYRGPMVLLLDEVQELEELGRKLPECVGGLHKLFDMNPRGFTLVLSFTTGARSTVRAILGEALYDRAAEVIALPPLTNSEAATFIRAVVELWSIDATLAPFPFNADSVQAVVKRLGDEGSALTPRVLMKAFDRVLREAEYDIETGEIGKIDADYAVRVLEAIETDELG